MGCRKPARNPDASPACTCANAGAASATKMRAALRLTQPGPNVAAGRIFARWRMVRKLHKVERQVRVEILPPAVDERGHLVEVFFSLGAVRLPLVPDRAAYRERHERLQRLARLTPWPRNVLRHSFGSYHLAFHKNEALTAAEMGNSPAVIFRHYRALVTPEAAERYWNLISETESDAQRMVEFAA